MSGLKSRIQERIDHAKERQQYWKEEKDIAKIWTAIESELTLVLRDLDEAIASIKKRAFRHGVNYWENTVMLEEVLAVLEGNGMKKAKP